MANNRTCVTLGIYGWCAKVTVHARQTMFSFQLPTQRVSKAGVRRLFRDSLAGTFLPGMCRSLRHCPFSLSVTQHLSSHRDCYYNLSVFQLLSSRIHKILSQHRHTALASHASDTYGFPYIQITALAVPPVPIPNTLAAAMPPDTIAHLVPLRCQGMMNSVS